MSSGNREVLASTVFVPSGSAVTSAYMRNMSGSATEKPTRIGTGYYRCKVPIDIDPLKTSVTTHGCSPDGFPKSVGVVFTRQMPPEFTLLDIYISDVGTPNSQKAENHLDADTVITTTSLAAPLLEVAFDTEDENEQVEVDFTFAGESQNTDGTFSTLVAEIYVDGNPLADSSGTGTTSLSGPDPDVQSGAIKRLVTLPDAGPHTIEVRAAKATGHDNFMINALSFKERNHASLVVTKSSNGAELRTDGASFVEVTLARLP